MRIIKTVAILIVLFSSTAVIADEEDPSVVKARHARAKAMQQQAADVQQGEVDAGAYQPQKQQADATENYKNQLRAQAQKSGDIGDKARREFANRELDRMSRVSTAPTESTSTTSQKTGNITHGSAGTTYQKIGDITYGSDGTTSQKIGNITYDSDGTTSQKIGNITYGSDGSTSQKIGDITYGSDGSTVQKIGNTTYGSDGTICQKIGNQTSCQ